VTNLNEPVAGSVVIIDTDMGYDDVMAIAMLLAADAPISGITTVNGIAHARQGAVNMLSLLERVGRRDIPVAVGADEPMAGGHAFKDDLRDEADALPERIEPPLPPTSLQPAPSSAAEFLINMVSKYPGRVTLLCLGPLTNIARALQLAGKPFVQDIKRIVMMGGAVRVPGNETPNEVSEWNLYVDPKAADQTIRSGISIAMVGLDVTNQAPTDRFSKTLGDLAPQRGAGDIMQEAFRHMYKYLYDPVAAAYLLDRSVLQTEQLPIQVVTEGRNVGQTVEDRLSGVTIEVALKLDERRFHDLLLKLISGT